MGVHSRLGKWKRKWNVIYIWACIHIRNKEQNWLQQFHQQKGKQADEDDPLKHRSTLVQRFESPVYAGRRHCWDRYYNKSHKLISSSSLSSHTEVSVSVVSPRSRRYDCNSSSSSFVFGSNSWRRRLHFLSWSANSPSTALPFPQIYACWCSPPDREYAGHTAFAYLFHNRTHNMNYFGISIR